MGADPPRVEGNEVADLRGMATPDAVERSHLLAHKTRNAAEVKPQSLAEWMKNHVKSNHGGNPSERPRSLDENAKI